MILAVPEPFSMMPQSVLQQMPRPYMLKPLLLQNAPHYFFDLHAEHWRRCFAGYSDTAAIKELDRLRGQRLRQDVATAGIARSAWAACMWLAWKTHKLVGPATGLGIAYA